MKFSVHGVLCAALFLPVSASFAKPREVPLSKTAPTFSSAADGYALWLPSKPTQSSRAQQIAGKSVAFRVVTASAAPFTFAVVSARLPAGMKTPDARRQLDAVQSGFLIPATRAGFSLQSSQDLRSNGVIGRELIVGSKTQPNLIRVRLFFKAPMSYQVMAVGPKNPSAAQRAQVGRVLDSFRMKPVAGAR